MSSSNRRRAPANDWWSHEIPKKELISVQHALADYIIDNELDPMKIQATTDTAKEVLGYMADLESRWSSVKRS